MLISYYVIRLLNVGDWGLGIGPNPQSPIPKLYNLCKIIIIIKKMTVIEINE